LLAGGVIVGLAVGRWWALSVAAAVGIWIGFTTKVEVGGLFLGTMYGLLAAAGITLGVLLRRRLRPY
jgi:hypothetical protein